MNGIRAGTQFGIRSVVKTFPYEFLFIVFVCSAIVACYIMTLFERPILFVDSKDEAREFGNIGTSLWLIFVTMTTVGYGDYTPKTIGGRAVGVIICIWGMFLTSFFTVTLQNYLEFGAGEKKSFLLLEKLHYKEKLKTDAIKALATLYRYRMALNREILGDPKAPKSILNNAREFRKQIFIFKETHKKINSLNDNSNY